MAMGGVLQAGRPPTCDVRLAIYDLAEPAGLLVRKSQVTSQMSQVRHASRVARVRRQPERAEASGQRDEAGAEQGLAHVADRGENAEDDGRDGCGDAADVVAKAGAHG